MGRKIDECAEKMSKNFFIEYKLLKIGFRNDKIGYYYLIDILDILINEGRIVHNFSKEIYPEIASKYNRNICTIERDIRSYINALWDIVLKDKLADFWMDSARPTCRQFIFLLKTYIMWNLS